MARSEDDAEGDELERIREKKREELLERHARGAAGGQSQNDPPVSDGPQTPNSSRAPDEPIEITGADHLDTVVRKYEVVLLDCYADWCGPCKMMEPVIDDVAATTDAAVAKLDVDANQQLAAQLGARSIPTLVLYKGGEPAQRLVGAQDRATLESLIQTHA